MDNTNNTNLNEPSIENPGGFANGNSRAEQPAPTPLTTPSVGNPFVMAAPTTAAPLANGAVFVPDPAQTDEQLAVLFPDPDEFFIVLAKPPNAPAAPPAPKKDEQPSPEYQRWLAHKPTYDEWARARGSKAYSYAYFDKEGQHRSSNPRARLTTRRQVLARGIVWQEMAVHNANGWRIYVIPHGQDAQTIVRDTLKNEAYARAIAESGTDSEFVRAVFGQKYVARFAAFVADLDNGTKPEQWQRLMGYAAARDFKWAMIVDSGGKSYHAYTALSDRPGPAALPEWKRGEQLLTAALQADSAMENEAQPIALAGFQYWKIDYYGLQVLPGNVASVVLTNPDAAYTLTELLTKLTPAAAEAAPAAGLLAAPAALPAHRASIASSSLPFVLRAPTALPAGCGISSIEHAKQHGYQLTRSILIEEGYQPAGQGPKGEHWTRPGKADGVSITLYSDGGVHVFSSSINELPPNDGHNPYDCIAVFEAYYRPENTAKVLGELGWGDPAKRVKTRVVAEQADQRPAASVTGASFFSSEKNGGLAPPQVAAAAQAVAEGESAILQAAFQIETSKTRTELSGTLRADWPQAALDAVSKYSAFAAQYASLQETVNAEIERLAGEAVAGGYLEMAAVEAARVKGAGKPRSFSKATTAAARKQREQEREHLIQQAVSERQQERQAERQASASNTPALAYEPITVAREPVEHHQVFSLILGSLTRLTDDEWEDVRQRFGRKSISREAYHVTVVQKIMAAATALQFNLCHGNSFLYVYNRQVWRAADKDELENFLGRAAVALGVPAELSEHFEFRGKLLKQFMSAAYMPPPRRADDVTLINMLNGTLEMRLDGTCTLREFRASDFLTYQLPFAYDPPATSTAWQKFLQQVQPDLERQAILAEFIGYSFVPTSQLKLEKALLLTGGGSNGKSVFFDVQCAVLGGHNIISYELHALSEEHNRAGLQNALLNYASEISPGKIDSGYVKTLISGERIQARLKYGNPFMMENYAKLAFNCNKLPHVPEHTHAWFRRLLIVPFEVTIDDAQQDRDLAKKLISTELPGIFNWVLDGLRRILSARGFSESRAVKAAVQKYKSESDNVFEFMNEQGHAPTKAIDAPFVLLKALFSDYLIFCRENNYLPLGKKNMRERLEALGYKIETRRHLPVVLCGTAPGSLQ